MLELPGWWTKGVAAALVLLAVGGTFIALADGMRDESRLRGCGIHGGTPAEDADAADCRRDRITITILDAVSRATFGPGIALVVLAGVYLLGSGIAARRGGHGAAEEGRP